MTMPRTKRGRPRRTGRDTRIRSALLLTGVLLAGVAAPPTAWAQDEAAALAAVEQIFEGMRQADAAMVRAVLAPDARFAAVDTRNVPASVEVQSVQGWLDAIGDSGGSWDEQIYDVEVRVDGNMASAWVPYTFYLDGSISHCGINSIEMLHDGAGWKVTQISDTRRRTDCPDPLG